MTSPMCAALFQRHTRCGVGRRALGAFQDRLAVSRAAAIFAAATVAALAFPSVVYADSVTGKVTSVRQYATGPFFLEIEGYSNGSYPDGAGTCDRPSSSLDIPWRDSSAAGFDSLVKMAISAYLSGGRSDGQF